MDTQEALTHLEQTGVMNSLTFTTLLAAILRVTARKQDNPQAFINSIRDEALAELEAAKYEQAETAELSAVRESSRVQIAAITALASGPPAAERLKARRP